jgi:hypothetical protein
LFSRYASRNEVADGLYESLLKYKISNVPYKDLNTIRYIDDVLSINNHNFHKYIHLIYPDELQIKDTTEFDKYASYLDIVLKIDTNGRLTTSFYDKRDDFDFVIVSNR